LLKPITGNTRVEVNYDCQEFLDIHQIVRARSLSVVASGVGAFWFNDTEIFRIAASFSISIDTTGFTIIASGRLTFGPRSSPLLSLNVTALFFLGVQGGKFGFAGSFMGNLTTGIEGLQLDVQALVQLNTFGRDVVFTIPQSNPAFETIRDEKGAVIETSRIEQVPAINDDGTPKLDPTTGQRLTTPITSRTVVVSGAAKNIDGTYQPAGYYVLIRAYGRLTIGNGFDVEGNLYFLLSETRFTLSLNGYLSLGPIGRVQVNAYADISGRGLVGVLRLEFSTGSALGESIGLSISGQLRMELNTTGVAQTVKLDERTTLDLAPGVLVRLEGRILFANVLDAGVLLAITYDSKSKVFRMDGIARASLAGIAEVDIKIGAEVTGEGIALGADIMVEADLVDIIKMSQWPARLWGRKRCTWTCTVG
jgi:hypothetical protein